MKNVQFQHDLQMFHPLKPRPIIPFVYLKLMHLFIYFWSKILMAKNNMGKNPKVAAQMENKQYITNNLTEEVRLMLLAYLQS